MKKIFSLFLVFSLIIFIPTPVLAAKPTKNIHATNQSGVSNTLDDSIVTTGYDKYGYNYKANIFNGFFENYSRPELPVDQGDRLVMKWNDVYSSNQGSSYVGTGAWITTHMTGEYEDWNFVSDWVLKFIDSIGNISIHNMTITKNPFVGTGVDLSTSQTWTVSTNQDDDGRNYMNILYDNNGQPYWIKAYTNTINDGEGISGTWVSSSGQTGTWSTISGGATKVVCRWDSFLKKVAKPTADYSCQYPYPAPDVDFCVIQEVSNNTCGNTHGLSLKENFPVGLGFFKPVIAP